MAFFIGAGVMAVGGIAEIFLGVRAERAQLEDIAKPLTVEEAEGGGSVDAGDPRSPGRPLNPADARRCGRAATPRRRGRARRSTAPRSTSFALRRRRQRVRPTEPRSRSAWARSPSCARAPSMSAAAYDEQPEVQAGDEAACERARAAQTRRRL